MEFEITFSTSALEDLEDVLKYYKEQEIPHVGQKLVNRVLQDVEILKDQPDSGRVVPEFEIDFLRELIRPPFRIVYLRDDQRIKIVRVWRSERLLILS